MISPRFLILRIRRLEIDSTLPVADGLLRRISNRSIRYEVDGRIVKHFYGSWAAATDKMLVFLGLETAEAQQARREWLQERLEDAIGDVA